MLTMRPHRCLSMCGTTARAMRNGPLTLVSIIIRQTAGSVCQKRVGVSKKSFADEAHASASIVHQNVNRTELANGAVYHTKAVVFAGRIGQHRVDRSCLLIRSRLLDSVEFVLVARGGNHHVGTGAHQTKSHRASKPAACSSDDRGPAPQ